MTEEITEQERAKYRPGGPITLAPHDARWAADFDAESARVARALGPVLVQIHHIGSTSVPGLIAKPVIDMLAVVTALDPLDRQAHALVALEYEALGEFGIAGRRYFRKTSANGVRLFQIHAFAVGSPQIRRHLDFRDHLRANPDDARRYAELKRELAVRFADDVERYADAKTEFIRAIERAVSSGFSTQERK